MGPVLPLLRRRPTTVCSESCKRVDARRIRGAAGVTTDTCGFPSSCMRTGHRSCSKGKGRPRWRIHPRLGSCIATGCRPPSSWKPHVSVHSSPQIRIPVVPLRRLGGVYRASDRLGLALRYEELIDDDALARRGRRFGCFNARILLTWRQASSPGRRGFRRLDPGSEST